MCRQVAEGGHYGVADARRVVPPDQVSEQRVAGDALDQRDDRRAVRGPGGEITSSVAPTSRFTPPSTLPSSRLKLNQRPRRILRRASGRVPRVGVTAQVARTTSGHRVILASLE